jgi:hypothetical protein
VPLFGKPKPRTEVAPPALPIDVSSQEFSLKLAYSARSSAAVRVKTGPGAAAKLARMCQGFAKEEPELVEAYPIELGRARPFIARMPEAAEWLTYHRKRPPSVRHALLVLEGTDCIDLAFETFVGGLLDGELEASGLPMYNAIVGGVVSHWDELTGDMVVRGVVGWGGEGVRGDTERNAVRILNGLFSNILGDPAALGVVSVDRPIHGRAGAGVMCAHCGFTSGHERAFYCPKCGMRTVRG